MVRAETIILLTVLIVGAAAFGLERLGPTAARYVGIGFCLFLFATMVVGLFFRARTKRARAEREAEAASRDGIAAETKSP